MSATTRHLSFFQKSFFCIFLKKKNQRRLAQQLDKSDFLIRSYNTNEDVYFIFCCNSKTSPEISNFGL